jgi:hypothetical protein
MEQNLSVKQGHIQNINPLSELLGAKSETLYFTFRFFLEHPDIFGSAAETLIYTNYAGQSVKAGVLYDIFESFVTQYNEEYIKKKMVGTLSLSDFYKYDVSFLITWAKIIRTNQVSLLFEPVFEKIRMVMKEWLANRKVYINGHIVDIEVFRSICYNKNGDNFVDLLPYICYVFTFLIYGSGYSFDEGISEASTFGFLKTIDGYLNAHYANFAHSYGDIDITRESFENILHVIPKESLTRFFEHVLSTRAIIGIRNAEINKTPEQLEQNISTQNNISMDTIRESWGIVMTNLIMIVVRASPLKQIFDKIPQFNRKAIDIDELILLTEYCISGGDKPFVIEPTEQRYSYLFNADAEALRPYPSFIQRQHISSDISPVIKPIQQPFNENDQILKIIGAYVRSEFVKKKNDMFDESPIEISDVDLRLFNDNGSLVPSYLDKVAVNYKSDKLQNIASILFNLFINGLWTYDNSSMSAIFQMLNSNTKFVSEISDILSLSYTTQIIWNNRLASTIFSTLCLSYLNTWLLTCVSNNLPLQTFSPMTYLVNMGFTKQVDTRIKHLCNMITSLLYIKNNKYTQFVNSRVTQILSYMTYDNKSFMQQVYFKTFNKQSADKAEFWAVGGIELYNFARHANPFVRGYAYNTRCYGNCEAMETFYKWTRTIDNTALFELIEQNRSNVGVIYTAIRNYMINLYDFNGHNIKTNETAQPPKLLSNYIFTDKSYASKGYPYFLDLNTSDGVNILTQICKYCFTSNKPTLEAIPRVCFRSMVCDQSSLIIGKLRVGEMNIPCQGNKCLNNSTVVPVSTNNIGKAFRVPVYNYVGSMEEISLAFQIPSGVHVTELVLFNSRVSDNSTILLFSAAPIIDRYQNYTLDLDNQVDESMVAKSNRVSRKFINNKTIDELRNETTIGDKYRIETNPASSTGMYNERLMSKPTRTQLTLIKNVNSFK